LGYKVHGIQTHLDHAVVGVSVGQEEGCLGAAPVRVDQVLVEHGLDGVEVVHVDGVVEGEDDHLRRVLRRQAARDAASVR
jgi:hypothetical protein